MKIECNVIHHARRDQMQFPETPVKIICLSTLVLVYVNFENMVIIMIKQQNNEEIDKTLEMNFEAINYHAFSALKIKFLI